jgi:2-polyprenyl-3-methyl-5-hydroxy-6-metoxy-1,4-benzoquinol methylase
MTTEVAPAAQGERTPDELVGRLFGASIGMFDVMSVYVGDQLGLYAALRDRGSATPPELARRAGIAPRYAREWLEQQAATGILEVENADAEPDDRRFKLPHAYVEPLLERDSLYSIAPMARAVVATAKALPKLMEAYRSGGGVEWADYGPDMIEAQGDFNRPWLVQGLGNEILPALPDIDARLRADPAARVADVACGVGWAAIAIAKAYPKVRVDGFDLDTSSIELARKNAADAGVADRVTFEVRDIAKAEPAAYDFAVIIEAVHDMTQPVGVLSSLRRMLKPDGIALVADEKTADTFTAPADDIERAYYGFSLFTCLPAVMTEQPTAAIGTVMRAPVMQRLVEQAGFGGFERLDEDMHDALRFYRLAP